MKAALQTISERPVPPLVAGDNLNREEFLRRWEASPHIKRAELIGGVVYLPTLIGSIHVEGKGTMPSPVSADHGRMEGRVSTWIGTYAAWTPGCEAGNNMTWLMLKDAPQPDVNLCILPDHGGQSRLQGKYAAGAPELITEVSLSSNAYDLHQKMELYREARVTEYLVILLEEGEARWHQLQGGRFRRLAPSADGVLASRVFPGLWLNVAGLFANDMKKVLSTLQEGLDAAAHAKFVARLTRKKASS